MVKLYKNFNIKNNHKNSLILIGNFDGVHLGHQKLFKLAKLYKKKYKLKIGVVNFDPMPKMFFNKLLKNFRITSINQKIELLSKLKVDFIITKKFDKKFSKTKSLNFIKEILNKKLKSKFIFVSNNFRFGNNREGNVNLIVNLPTGKRAATDGAQMRRLAVELGIPFITTITGAKAAIQSLEEGENDYLMPINKL